MDEKKKGALGKVLAIVGALVVIGGAVAAVIHFWEQIKEKLPCCKKDEFEGLEDFLEDELDELEDVAEDLGEEMEDFVEFEEI